jgi:hypothetical protein
MPVIEKLLETMLPLLDEVVEMPVSVEAVDGFAVVVALEHPVTAKTRATDVESAARANLVFMPFGRFAWLHRFLTVSLDGPRCRDPMWLLSR